MDEPIDDNVISLDANREAPTPTVRGRTYCAHQRIDVDEHKRTVECSTCGAMLDPVGALISMASLFQRRKAEYVATEQRHRKLTAEIAMLERRERNAKTRVKRHEGKVLDMMSEDEARAVIRARAAALAYASIAKEIALALPPGPMTPREETVDATGRVTHILYPRETGPRPVMVAAANYAAEAVEKLAPLVERARAALARFEVEPGDV